MRRQRLRVSTDAAPAWKQTIQMPARAAAAEGPADAPAGCSCSEVTLALYGEPAAIGGAATFLPITWNNGANTHYLFLAASGSICSDMEWTLDTVWAPDVEPGEEGYPDIQQAGTASWIITGGIEAGVLTITPSAACGGETLAFDPIEITVGEILGQYSALPFGDRVASVDAVGAESTVNATVYTVQLAIPPGRAVQQIRVDALVTRIAGTGTLGGLARVTTNDGTVDETWAEETAADVDSFELSGSFSFGTPLEEYTHTDAELTYIGWLEITIELELDDCEVEILIRDVSVTFVDPDAEEE